MENKVINNEIIEQTEIVEKLNKEVKKQKKRAKIAHGFCIGSLVEMFACFTGLIIIGGISAAPVLGWLFSGLMVGGLVSAIIGDEVLKSCESKLEKLNNVFLPHEKETLEKLKDNKTEELTDLEVETKTIIKVELNENDSTKTNKDELTK